MASAAAPVAVPEATVSPGYIDRVTPFAHDEQGVAASCATADDCFALGLDGGFAYTTDATAGAPTWTLEQLPWVPDNLPRA